MNENGDAINGVHTTTTSSNSKRSSNRSRNKNNPNNDEDNNNNNNNTNSDQNQHVNSQRLLGQSMQRVASLLADHSSMDRLYDDLVSSRQSQHYRRQPYISSEEEREEKPTDNR